MPEQTSKTGIQLERQVADAYRALGARRVEHDVEVAGHQIDVYVQMETADHSLHRIAVEAKDHKQKVGIAIVQDFAAVVSGLRRLGRIDEGTIVSAHGYSRQARNRARDEGLRLLEPSDLEAMQAGVRPASGPLAAPADDLPGTRAPLGRASGSPFVLGRPLRATEPIFGRDEAFRFLAGQLASFSSTNLVGERRMGKTSVLNHLAGRQDELLIPQPDQPALVLACLDLQGGVTSDTRFCGAALRELLDRLPPSRGAEAQSLQEWRQRLHARPDISYDELQSVLKRLRDTEGVSVRPVLIVDEFERLLGPMAQEEFPIPHFFDGLRALITADLLAMVVASRRPLADYFQNPELPNSLTSSFPTYFALFRLAPLDDAAADALLLQDSEHALTLEEASRARHWAVGHPCHLQAAGQAWYEAKASSRDARWAERRFAELKDQCCMVAGQPLTPKTEQQLGWVRGLLRSIFWSLPLKIGQLAQHLGARFDDVAAWLLGAAIVVVILLAVLGIAEATDLLGLIKKALGS